VLCGAVLVVCLCVCELLIFLHRERIKAEAALVTKADAEDRTHDGPSKLPKLFQISEILRNFCAGVHTDFG